VNYEKQGGITMYMVLSWHKGDFLTCLQNADGSIKLFENYDQALSESLPTPTQVKCIRILNIDSGSTLTNLSEEPDNIADTPLPEFSEKTVYLTTDLWRYVGNATQWQVYNTFEPNNIPISNEDNMTINASIAYAPDKCPDGYYKFTMYKLGNVCTISIGFEGRTLIPEKNYETAHGIRNWKPTYKGNDETIQELHNWLVSYTGQYNRLAEALKGYMVRSQHSKTQNIDLYKQTRKE